jgi:hypothetical protein
VNAAWAGVLVTVALVAGGGIGAIWRAGRRDGKVDAVLEQLTDIAQDHETRLRIVEHKRAPERRSR